MKVFFVYTLQASQNRMSSSEIKESPNLVTDETNPVVGSPDSLSEPTYDGALPHSDTKATHDETNSIAASPYPLSEPTNEGASPFPDTEPTYDETFPYPDTEASQDDEANSGANSPYPATEPTYEGASPYPATEPTYEGASPCPATEPTYEGASPYPDTEASQDGEANAIAASPYLATEPTYDDTNSIADSGLTQDVTLPPTPYSVNETPKAPGLPDTLTQDGMPSVNSGSRFPALSVRARKKIIDQMVSWNPPHQHLPPITNKKKQESGGLLHLSHYYMASKVSSRWQ